MQHKFDPRKLEGVGYDFEDFQNNLRSTLDQFEPFLADVKKSEGNGTFEGKNNNLLFISITYAA